MVVSLSLSLVRVLSDREYQPIADDRAGFCGWCLGGMKKRVYGSR